MKGEKMKKALIIGCVVIVLLGVVGYFFISFYAVKFIQSALQKKVGPGFTIEKIEATWHDLTVWNISYYDPQMRRKTLTVPKVKIYPSLSTLLHGTITLRNIVVSNPTIFVYRTASGVLRVPWKPQGKPQEKSQGKPEAPPSKKKTAEKGLKVVIEHIRVQNGAFDFEDDKSGTPPFKIQLTALAVGIDNIQIPATSQHTNIHFKSQVKGTAQNGSIAVDGWRDFKTSDMNMHFKVGGMELTLFEPYYRSDVHTTITSGYVNADVGVTVANQMLDSPGEFEVNDFTISKQGILFKMPANQFSEKLAEKKNYVKIPFHVSGNLRDPQFSYAKSLLKEVAKELTKQFAISAAKQWLQKEDRPRLKLPGRELHRD